MNITVEVSESEIAKLVRERIAELFSSDARYRETAVRGYVRSIVDHAAVEAVRGAQEAIASQLPEMAVDAVTRATKAEMEAAAKRGLRAFTKLNAGFNPNRMIPELKAWLEHQLAKAADIEPQIAKAATNDTAKPD
jgi:hypothetical protein